MWFAGRNTRRKPRAIKENNSLIFLPVIEDCNLKEIIMNAAQELVKVAKSLTAGLTTYDMRDIYLTTERQTFSRLAKNECVQFAREVSKAIANNRDNADAAVPYHARTDYTAMNMNGVNYFADSILVTAGWEVRLFFTQEDWTCYAVVKTNNKKLDGISGESSPERIGKWVAQVADAAGLQ